MQTECNKVCSLCTEEETNKNYDGDERTICCVLSVILSVMSLATCSAAFSLACLLSNEDGDISHDTSRHRIACFL